MNIKLKLKNRKPKIPALVWCFAIPGLLSCGNEHNEKAAHDDTGTALRNVPAVLQYSVVREYPHDTKAFTEGLQYVDGILYEGTGEYGASDVRKTELATGKVITSHKMADKYFGEGITVLNGKLYQLTYRERTGFIYDAGTLQPQGTFSYNAAEGWGMTTDGRHLIYDDGKNLMHYIEPGSFREVKTLHVTDENGAVDNINELEFIRGYIYANQWETSYILKIDTASGKVVARADLSELSRMNGPQGMSTDGSRGPDAMNGIAYDSTGNRIFITGKYWPKLYEVKLDN